MSLQLKTHKCCGYISGRTERLLDLGCFCGYEEQDKKKEEARERRLDPINQARLKKLKQEKKKKGKRR